MAKRSDDQQQALAGLLGLGNHSARKSHYPELTARLDELEAERNRYIRLNDELEQRVAARTDELLEANRNLQQQIAQREQVEQELRDARDAAEAANRSKDKYLAAASHDLLQPLNAARLLISTLRERNLPSVEQVLVERTHQALEGAEDLLTDLLDISRLDQAAVKPDVALYRLDELFAPLVSEFQSVALAAGLNLRARTGHYAIRTDLRLVTRILRNFLSNACRYTDEAASCSARAAVATACAWRCGTPGAASRPTGSTRSSSNSTSSTSAAPRTAKAWGWDWRLSSVSPRSSATRWRSVRGRGVARCSASRCPSAKRCPWRSANCRCCRPRATRCRGGVCW
jgi:hypothetical protein